MIQNIINENGELGAGEKEGTNISYLQRPFSVQQLGGLDPLLSLIGTLRRLSLFGCIKINIALQQL